MRILMLIPRAYSRGLGDQLIPHLVSALKNLGSVVDTPTWGRHNREESIFKRVIGRLQDINKVKKTILQGKYDVMLVETSHGAWGSLLRDITLLLFIRRIVPRIILQFHGSQSDRLIEAGNYLFKLFSSFLIRLTDGALVLSTEEKKQWQSFYPGVPFYMVKNPYLSNGIESLPRNREGLNLPDDIPIILFVGRLVKQKGICPGSASSTMPLAYCWRGETYAGTLEESCEPGYPRACDFYRLS